MSPVDVGGLLNTRNGIVADAQFRHQMQQQSLHMDAHSAYGMNHPAMAHHQHQHHHHHHPHSLSQPSALFAQMAAPQQQMMPLNYMSSHLRMGTVNQMDSSEVRPRIEPAPKAFACSTCTKGFARRSDLARHERIHSGVRPHACDFPGCGKEFIQRSALTVHTRVHTGEKPHMCEKCGKPFSDSSSLARHRRIHSGKRPYKCPYANCQKTFTRRTTLTRHQNHHTGTVEEAQAETSAKLSLTQSQSQSQSVNGSFSNDPSPTSTASPPEALGLPVNHPLSSMQVMAQHNGDFHFMPQHSHHTQALPAHLRPDFHPHPTRVTQSLNSPSLSAYSGLHQPRINMRAQAGNTFAPRQPMEPSTTNAASGNTSPHMASMGWVSPTNPGLSGATTMEAYYGDQSGYANQAATAYGAPGMYYHPTNVRRPQSTEPEDYMRPRSHMGHHLPAGTIAISEPTWMQMQQRDFAVGH